MGFIPSELVEANPSGDVSYLLERNRVLRNYERGEVTRNVVMLTQNSFALLTTILRVSLPQTGHGSEIHSE